MTGASALQRITKGLVMGPKQLWCPRTVPNLPLTKPWGNEGSAQRVSPEEAGPNWVAAAASRPAIGKPKDLEPAKVWARPQGCCQAPASAAPTLRGPVWTGASAEGRRG